MVFRNYDEFILYSYKLDNYRLVYFLKIIVHLRNIVLFFFEILLKYHYEFLVRSPFVPFRYQFFGEIAK